MNSKQITNLESNTLYSFTISAVNKGGETIPSDEMDGVTYPGKANPPQSIGATSSSISLQWDEVNEGSVPRNYLVRWDPPDDQGINFHVVENSNSDMINNLIPSTEYSFNITSENDAGFGETSDTVFIVTNPEAPQNINLSSQKNTIIIKWNPPRGRFDEVVIESTNDSFQTIFIRNRTTNHVMICGLEYNTSYVIVMYSVAITSNGRLESLKLKNSIKTGIESEPTNSNLTTIIGAVVGSILAVSLLTIGGVYYWKRKSHKPTESNISSTHHENTVYVNEFVNPSKQKFSTDILPMEECGTRIPLRDFDTHVRNNQENNDFNKEFQKIVLIGRDLSTQIGSKSVNKKKNRNKEIVPYDNNRVTLTSSQMFPSTYINASYIEGFNENQKWIATQAPLSSTVDDFWRMIWEKNCTCIVMLTQLVENGKEKCHQYWPQDCEELNYGGIDISIISFVKRDWIDRKIQISRNGETRVIRHFHYTTWPDTGVPVKSQDFIRFVSYMGSELTLSSTNVVHCSSGVGRTGVFIAVDYLLQHLNTNPSTIDIFDLVMNLNGQRRFFIQTKEQYEFLHVITLNILNHEYEEIRDVNEYMNRNNYETMINSPVRDTETKQTYENIKLV